MRKSISRNKRQRLWLALAVAGLMVKAGAQTNFFWTNTVGNLWNSEIWTNETGAGLAAPAPGGANNYILSFSSTAGAFGSTNDLGTTDNNGFLLNQLIFSNAAVVLAGSNLVLVSTGGGTSPKILQSGASNVTIGCALILSNQTLVGGGGAGALTNSGALSGAGALTKTGSYNLVLSGANAAYDGVITNRGTGRLVVLTSTGLGSTNAGTVLVCNGTSGTGNMIQFGSGVNITNEAITITGSGGNRGALYTTVAASYTGTITLASSAAAQLYVDAAAARFFVDGLITNTGTASLSLRGSAGTGTVAATISIGAATALGKTDGSTWVIQSTNNVWGNTGISTGTIKLGAPDALPVTTVVTLGQASGGNTPTFDLGGFNQTITGLTTAGNETGNIWRVTSPTAALLTINNTANYIYSGTVTKAVALLKTGAGRLTLSGTNSYTGDTTISNGLLLLAGVYAAPSSTVVVVVNNGLAFSNLTAISIGGLAGSGDLALINDLGTAVALGVGQNGSSTLYSGSLSGAGGLTKLGSGTLTLTGLNTYGGGTVLAAGSLVFGNTSAIADATLTISNGTTMGTAFALDQSFLSRITTTSSGTVALAVDSANDLDFGTPGLATVSLGAVAGTTNVYAGNLSPANNLFRLGGGGGLLVIGSALSGANGLVTFTSGTGGALMLSNNNSYTLGTTIPTGTVVLGVTDALPTTTALTLGDSANKAGFGVLDLNGNSQTIGSLATPRIVQGGTTNNATTTNSIINIAAGQSLNIITNTTGNVLSVAEGTHLQVSGAGALNMDDPRGAIIINGMRSSTTYMGLDLSRLGTFTARVDSLTVGFDNNNAVRQALLNMALTNTLTVNTLTVGSSSLVGSLAGRVNLGQSNRLNVANLYLGLGKGLGTVTFADSVTNGNLFLTGTGLVANTRANVTLGSFRNAGGTQPIGYLMITNLGASITANLGTLILGSLEASNSATAKGGYGYFTFNDGAVDVNSVILGQSTAAGISGTGYGLLTMNGGGLTVNSSFIMGKKGDALLGTTTGVVVFAGGTATMNTDLLDGGGFSSVTLGGGTLDMQGHNLGDAVNPLDALNLQSGTLKNVGEINGGAALVKTGGGVLVLDGNNTYSGGTVISNGTLQVGAGGTSGNLGPGLVDNLGTVLFNRTDQFTVNNTLTGSGTMIQLGAGTVNLTGDGSGFAGSTQVSNGTLRANGLLGGLISVYNGGTLGGTGALSTVQLLTGSTLSPGNSVGQQLITSLSLSNATVRSELISTSSYDQVMVASSLTFEPGSTNNLHLVLTAYTGQMGAEFVILRNDSLTPWDGASIFFLNDLGADNGLALTNGIIFRAVGESGTTNLFRINYDVAASGDGVGNDIVLTMIPEPAALHLLLVLGVVGWLCRRLGIARPRRNG